MNLVLRPDVAATNTEHGMVLLDEDAGRYWQLNRTAAFILRTLLDGITPQETAQRLAARYSGVTAERAAADVASLVSSLSAARLVAHR